nr:MAG TPA: tail fiber protein [Caudoviricetes sp.]
MAILFKNNAASTLNYMYQAPDKDFVDIYVTDHTVFPTIAPESNDYFYLTLVGENTLEIVKVFAQITNVNTGKLAFRSYRAQEGTTAQEWVKGTRVEMRITADALNSFVPTAVQLAKDYVDATGVASTTNVGFAGVDGKTTQANAEGVVTAKDVAVGGNLEDLASARGQIGNSKTQGSHDFSSGMLSEKPGMYTATKSGSTNVPFTGPFAEMILGTPTHRGSLLITSGRPSSPRAAISAIDMNEGGGFSGYNRLITEQQVGDGIRVSDGIISVPEYDGATASTAGTAGLVPPAAAGEQESFLTGGGEYKPALSTKGGLLTGSVQINDTANVISTAPATNSEHGLFVADKNGAIKGGFDSIQRSYDNAKWTQLFSKASGGTIASLGVVAYEDGTGEVITYNPLLLNTTQLKEIIDNGNRVFILGGDRSKPGYTFRFSPDTGEAYMDGRAIHAKADSAIHADTAGTATIAESAAYWKAQNSGRNYIFHDEVLGENPPYIMGYALNNLFKIYSTGSLSVNYANSAGSAPANGGTSWATTVTPNVVCGGRVVPAGGSWAVIYRREGYTYAQMYAGGTTLGIDESIIFAIRVS